MITFILILIIPLLLLGYITYQQSANSLNELGEQNLRNSVIYTNEMINMLNEEVEEGNISLEEAQEKIKVMLLGGERSEDGKRPIDTNIDLGENGYIYITDEKGILLAHPNLEGESLWESKDSSGDLFMQDITDKALNNGGGFVYYDWPLPKNENAIEEKVVYTQYNENWGGWIINASTYIMDFNAPADTILYQILIVTIIFVIIGVIIGWLFSGNITKPLQLVTNRMKQLANGNLSLDPVEVKTKDELSILALEMNNMQTELNKMILNITEASNTLNQQSDGLNKSSNEVKLGSEQVTTTMEELASGAEVQADHVSRLAQMMENFKEIVSETNQQGTTVGNVSMEVLNKAESGSNLMQSSANQMTKIDQIVKEAVEKVRSLDSQSQEIGRLVSVIRDIAEQTNLLALNAAIELQELVSMGKDLLW